MHKTLSFLGLLLALALPVAAQDSALPRFEPGACPFAVPSGSSPECGVLVVPEDRANPQGATLELAVALFPSTNPDKSAFPLLYLDGGPGGSTLEALIFTYNTQFRPLTAEQDLILFDQRGIGLSQPALDCREVDDFVRQAFEEGPMVDDYVAGYVTALNECGARLASEDINLAAYNSAANAADVNDLRAALGYEKLNLFGVSYGSRLALTVMRDFPEAVNSAIIDAVYPPQVALSAAPLNFTRALRALFDGCTADAACAAAYPNLEATFYDTIRALDAAPARFPVTDARNGQTFEAVMDGTTFASLIFQALYATEIVPALPQSIVEVSQADYGFAALFIGNYLFQLEIISGGMNAAVQCGEEYGFDTPEVLQGVLDSLPPELVGFAREGLIDPQALPASCSTFNSAAPNPAENQAVSSDIPTLVLSGQYDPITPPEWGALAAETLPNSTVLTFPDTGHGAVFGSECAMQIALGFVADPTAAVDTACLAEQMPVAFVVPGAAVSGPIEFEPFVNEISGFETVKPIGWQELMAGIFARQSTGLDQTALTFQLVPGGIALPLIARQFGADVGDVVVRDVNGIEWSLLEGELQGQTVLLALADNDGQVALIVVTTNPEERDAIYDGVFLPVVDAFRFLP